MFWAGSKGLTTPRAEAVAGMSCMSPMAPLGDRARGLKADSTWMTARTRSALTPAAAACSSMSGSNRADFWSDGRVTLTPVARATAKVCTVPPSARG